MNNTLTKNELSQFSGTTGYTRINLFGALATDGIVYVAEKAGAFWLMDCISAHLIDHPYQEAKKKDPRLESMVFWRLTVKDNRGRLTARADDGEPYFVDQAIGYTDFPLDELDIWTSKTPQGWVFMLKSEY